MAPRRIKFRTKFTPYYIDTATPIAKSKRPVQWELDSTTCTTELRMHLAAARILSYSQSVPLWHHPTSGKTIALTDEAADGLVEGVVRRWVRVGVKSMENLHAREIGGLRSLVDDSVADFLGVGVGDLYAAATEGQSHQCKKVERPELEAISVKPNEGKEIGTE
ncbi:hypothetical protein L211DRAFT_231387 [Terfezia boudieri ATCC MYA-4762]|uniref:Uncharacterized protein n=1 Tax=Terfezia boudieri ATCC MYA-4762 TaxID=1051890 RepID=A0A3N4L9E2_9PEZI|nr:hypothetical protein L211DRAFT_231387 [Terfezia boudieri ATCC MYA-4762]